MEDENDDSGCEDDGDEQSDRILSNNLSFQNVLCIVCVNNIMFRILY
jgi:hypothetical protein